MIMVGYLSSALAQVYHWLPKSVTGTNPRRSQATQVMLTGGADNGTRHPVRVISYKVYI